MLPVAAAPLLKPVLPVTPVNARADGVDATARSARRDLFCVDQIMLLIFVLLLMRFLLL